MELCADLCDGGVTPSVGLIHQCVAAASAAAIPDGSFRVNVLIRPRPGDFLYDDDEKAVMLADISAAIASGAHGIVIGALTSDGDIDAPFLASCMDIARPAGVTVTFHRAIDVCRDYMAAVRHIVAAGVDYILSSGQAPTASDGVHMLRAAVEACAGSKTRVIAGGGVTPSTAPLIVSQSGVTQLHGTARVYVPGGMAYKPAVTIYMGSERRNTEEVEFGVKRTDAATVARIIAAAADAHAKR